MNENDSGSRTTINLSVPADMRKWLDQKAIDGETKVAPVVRAIIRKVMNEEEKNGK